MFKEEKRKEEPEGREASSINDSFLCKTHEVAEERGSLYLVV